MPTKFVERKETGEQSLWGGNIFYKGSDYVSTSDTTAGRSRSRANMIFHFMCALRNYADSTRHATYISIQESNVQSVFSNDIF